MKQKYKRGRKVERIIGKKEGEREREREREQIYLLFLRRNLLGG